MPANKKIWITLILLVAVVAIILFDHAKSVRKSGSEIIAGGGPPCRYDSGIIPAKVIQIKLDTQFAYIQVLARGSDSMLQTFSIGRVPPYKVLTKAEVLASGIREGDSIKCMHNLKIEGDCSPEIFTMIWEKY